MAVACKGTRPTKYGLVTGVLQYGCGVKGRVRWIVHGPGAITIGGSLVMVFGVYPLTRSFHHATGLTRVVKRSDEPVDDCEIPRKENLPIFFIFFASPPLPVSPGSREGDPTIY